MKNQNQSPQEPLTQKEIIAFLRTHKDKLERDFGVTQIALFGSYARGEQGPTSDIDFVIEMPEPSFKNHCRLKEFLEKHLKKNIDLCYFKGMRSFIRHAIDQELVYA